MPAGYAVENQPMVRQQQAQSRPERDHLQRFAGPDLCPRTPMVVDALRSITPVDR
jgi:hypothetical protein